MYQIEKKILSLFLVLAMAIGLFPESFAFADTDGAKDSAADKIGCSKMLLKRGMAFANGNGTENSPYQISTAAQLNAMRNNLSAHYVLIADIDLSKFGAWTPVGTHDAPFSGALDGQNHKIIGLTINNTSVVNWVASNISKVSDASVGLFGEVSSETKFVNLTFKGYSVTINPSIYSVYSGAVLGKTVSVNTNNISITNCSVDGSASISLGNSSSIYIGGIIGDGHGDYMSNCVNNAVIFSDSSDSTCGGIAGYLGTTQCDNCKNTGTITGESQGSFGSAGGITGNAAYSSLTDCINRGNVSAVVKKYLTYSSDAENSMAGGIAGFAGGSIKACDNYGNISADMEENGSSSAGGICGYQSSYSDDFIESCKNYGENITAVYHKCKDEKNKIWEQQNGYAARICGVAKYGHTGNIKNNYSLGSTTINAAIPSADIAADKINGATLSGPDQPNEGNQWSGWGQVSGNTDQQMTIGGQTYSLALTEPLILSTDSYKGQYVAYQLNDQNQITRFHALKEMTEKFQSWDNTTKTLVVGDGPNTANYKPNDADDPAFLNFLASADASVGKDVKIIYDQTAQSGDSGPFYTLFRIEPYASSTITGKLTLISKPQKQATVGDTTYPADGSILDALQNDLNQDVVCTLRNNTIHTVMKVSEVGKGLSCSLQLNSSLKYQDGKYSADSLTGVLTVTNAVSPSFQGDVSVLKDVSVLNAKISKVTLESESNLFNLNHGLFQEAGSLAVQLPDGGITLYAGETKKINVSVPIKTDYKPKDGETASLKCMTEGSYAGKSVSDEQDCSIKVNSGTGPAPSNGGTLKNDFENIIQSSQSVNLLNDEFENFLTKSQMKDLRAALALWLTIISDPDISDSVKNAMYDYQYKNGTVTSSYTIPIELKAANKKYGLRHFRFDATITDFHANFKVFGFTIGNIGTIQSINWNIADWQKSPVVPSFDRSGILGVDVQANIKELNSAVDQCTQNARQECASLGVDSACSLIDKTVAAFGGSAVSPFITTIIGKAIKVIACGDQINGGDVADLVERMDLSDSGKLLKINCPVDVYVFYKGSPCGAVVNNMVDASLAKSTFGSAVSVDGDRKTVYVPNDGVSVKLVGNDAGTMDYEIDEYSNVTGDMPARTVAFHNLPLTKGKTYTGTVSDKLQEAKSTYDLTSDSKTVQADYDSASQNTGGGSHGGGSGGHSGGSHGSGRVNPTGQSAVPDSPIISTAPVTARVMSGSGTSQAVTESTVVEIPISGMFQVGLTSGQKLNSFHYNSGNGSVVQTGTVSGWNGTDGVYSICAVGKVGQVTGIYANGVLLFQAKIIASPFKCDTTVDIQLPVNTDYTFCIQPQKQPKEFTFFTANGGILQTCIVKDRYPAKDRRYFCRVKPARKFTGLIGVYCRIDGFLYKVFSVGCK